MGPLVLLLAVLASAQDLTDLKKNLGAYKAEKADPHAPCDPAKKDCRCPGKRGLQAVFYEHSRFSRTPFYHEIVSNATIALKRYGLDLIKPPEREDGLGGHKVAVYDTAIEDFIALCQVVTKSFKDSPPEPGYLPVFLLKFGGSLKKQIGTDVAGKNFPKGIKESCDIVGEPGPATAMAFVDLEPEQEIKQVLIHELGHAVGHSAGVSAAFADVYDKQARNVMASQRSLAGHEDMLFTPAQVKGLCSSPYVK